MHRGTTFHPFHTFAVAAAARSTIMTEELKVVLRRSENSGFGFSLLGTTGPPHVIYDIIENSPAADCGAVSENKGAFFYSDNNVESLNASD